MFDNGKTDINTFTVEVENEKYDESKWANKVARNIRQIIIQKS